MVIPTADGLVVAADSRGVVEGRFIDGRNKLHVADTRLPVVFALTGTADFPKVCPQGVSFSDWMTNPPYAFRASESVLRYLKGNPAFLLTAGGLRAAAAELSGELREFLGRFPQTLDAYSDRAICTLVMCQTESRDQALCGSVDLAVDWDGEFVLSKLRVGLYRRSDKKVLKLFGERHYAQDFVLPGEGMRFLNADETSLWNSRSLVSDVSGREGTRFASSIIHATERATVLVTLPSGGGVGGAVKAVILTSTHAAAA